MQRTFTPTTYLDAVTAAVVAAFTPPTLEHDYWTGAVGVYVTVTDSEGTVEPAILYATPGWDGGALPWCLYVDGDTPHSGEAAPDWTGDPAADVETWLAEVHALIATLPGVALARVPVRR